MKQNPRYRALILAIYPSPYGFAWVAFENPFSPYDWGMVHGSGMRRNEWCLRKITRLIERLTPETIVLEAFEAGTSLRKGRTVDLCRAVVAYGIEERIDVAVYRFSDVQLTFSHLGARTRHEIAEAVARQFWAFKHLLPKHRRAWDPQSRKMALFNAIALALTHYQRDAWVFLENIKEGSP